MGTEYMEPTIKIAIAKVLIEQATKMIAEAMLLRHTAAIETNAVSDKETFEQFVSIDLNENFELVADVCDAANKILRQ